MNQKSTELDIETLDLSPFNSDMVSIQVGDRFFDLYPNRIKELPNWIRDILEDPTIEKIIHNAHFEFLWMLVKFGVKIQNFQCSQLAAFLTLTRGRIITPKKTKYSVALKPLVMDLFQADASEFEEFDKFGGIVAVTRFLYDNQQMKRAKGLTKEIIYPKFKSYAVKDNVFARMVWGRCIVHPEWQNVQRVYQNEIKLIPVLAQMEIDGMHCNRDAVMERIEEVKEMLKVHEANLQGMLAGAFDPAESGSDEWKEDDEVSLSGRGMGELLRNKCGVPLTEKNKDGYLKCDSKYTLPKFMNHPVVRELVVYRKLKWTLSTCLKRWADDSADGSPIRTKINAMGAVHGRMSASDPNLMNVPKRGPSKDELAVMLPHIAKSYSNVADLRKFFEPRPGFTFYMCDWSQIELVIAAFYSRDVAFLKAFRDNVDAHRQTAADALGIPPEAVTDEQRQNYKEDGFGILYGSGNKAIAERIVNKQGIPYEQAYPLAQARYKGWFAAHPQVRECNNIIKDVLLTDDEQRDDHERLQESQRAKGGKTWDFRHYRKVAYRGYLRNLFGRIWKPDKPGDHYKGLEAIVSGTATGDMTKIAMNRVFYEVIQANKMESRLLLPVHDELIFEVRDGEETVFIPKVKTIMEDYPEVTAVVPVRVDIDRSKLNWKDKEKVYDSKKCLWVAPEFVHLNEVKQ